MQITSTNFQHLETIPVQFTAYGDNTSPALTFSEIPEDTQSLVLIVDDPDAPNGLFTHWTIFNMSPGTLQLIEGELPLSGIPGKNDSGVNEYFGPKPPEGTGEHRYFFRLYALDEQLDLPEGVDSATLRDALSDHIIDETELIGTFSYEDKE